MRDQKTQLEQSAEKLIPLGFDNIGMLAADFAEQPKSSVGKIAFCTRNQEKTTVPEE